MIICYTEVDEERERLEQLVKEYQTGVRELLSKVSAETGAEVRAVNEKMLGRRRTSDATKDGE